MAMPMPMTAFRMRPQDARQLVLELGQRADASLHGVPVDPAAAFVPAQRLLLTRGAAQRLADGLARALGLPLAPLTAAAGPGSGAGLGGGPGLGPAAMGTASSAPSAAPAPPDDLLAARGRTPRNAAPDPAGTTAARLMQAVKEMAPEHYQERSFRIAPQSLQANRFLLSINGRQLPPDALERCWHIARSLGMPLELRAQVEQAFAWGDHVHFGFEGEADRQLCKLYLERTVRGLDAARAAETGEPALQYIAFKWNVDGGPHVVSHYHWHAGLSAQGVAERMAQVCAGAAPALAEMAQTVLDAAAARLPPQRLLYLEVTEAGQPRRSFDLNLYDARLLVRDQQAVLFAMRDHFGVRPGQFQALYDQIKARPLGHLAGGVHRNGQAFFTVYFGGTRPR